MEVQYRSKVSWHSKLETRSSILASRSSNASSFEMRGSSLEVRGSSLETRGSSLEFRWSRIEYREARFSERTTLYSCVAVQIFAPSICPVLAVRCSVTVWITRLRQAFNKCKSIFLVSKIYPACTVYVSFARHVPRFSQMNGAALQICEWSLSQFYANHDEDYESWVVEIWAVKLQPLSRKGGLEHVAFHPQVHTKTRDDSLTCRAFGVCKGKKFQVHFEKLHQENELRTGQI